MRTISLRYVGDDAAVVHMYTEGRRGESWNEGEDVRRTHVHLVLAKRNAAWKVVHTAIMDARNGKRITTDAADPDYEGHRPGEVRICR